MWKLLLEIFLYVVHSHPTASANMLHVQLMKSYESSNATLRMILSHPSLQRDRIDETMDALAEANMDAKELDDSIRDGADLAIGAPDMIDVEDELAELVREVEGGKTKDGEREVREKLEGLHVPLGEPAEGESSHGAEKEALPVQI